jgi:hypothetical protein
MSPAPDWPAEGLAGPSSATAWWELNRRWLVLSADERQAWEDIQRYYDAEAEEPVRIVPLRTSQRRRPGRGLDDLPAAVVAGVWITIILVFFGAAVAGLAVAVATAVGWAMWRWWPDRGSDPDPSSPPEREGEGPGVPSIAAWQGRLRRLPGAE